MRYDEKTATISLPLSELVSLSLHRFASETANERDEDIVTLPSEQDRPAGIGAERTLSHTFSEGGHRFLLTGTATGVTEPPAGMMGALPCLTLLRLTNGDPKNPDRETVRRVRGELFGLAFLYFATGTPVGSVRARMQLTNPQRGESGENEETITRSAATAFFEKLRTCLGKQAAEEVDRVYRRLPTLDKLAFPYSSRREAQEQMIQAA